jgi:hypothetical protein
VAAVVADCRPMLHLPKIQLFSEALAQNGLYLEAKSQIFSLHDTLGTIQE